MNFFLCDSLPRHLPLYSGGNTRGFKSVDYKTISAMATPRNYTCPQLCRLSYPTHLRGDWCPWWFRHQYHVRGSFCSVAYLKLTVELCQLRSLHHAAFILPVVSVSSFTSLYYTIYIFHFCRPIYNAYMKVRFLYPLHVRFQR